jgi:hypothetical protein
MQVSLLNAKLNPIFNLLALFGAHLILHVSRIRAKRVLSLRYHKREKRSKIFNNARCN